MPQSSTKPQHIVEARTAAPPCAGPSGRSPSASPGAYHQAPLGMPLAAAAGAGPASCQATVVAPRPGVVAGFPRFVKANHLHRNSRRYLQEDTLTIRCVCGDEGQRQRTSCLASCCAHLGARLAALLPC